MNSRFFISLDFELLWGVRDHLDRSNYGENILGARDAIPRILDLFAGQGINATWATVGFLFCESKEELFEFLPEQRPCYKNSALSNYRYLDEVGKNEDIDPYCFAPSLIDKIRRTPGQEIATHTLSHFYCLEDGATLEAFEADLKAAQQLAARRGISLRSIVFPRNQYAQEHLAVCRRLGFTTYRGNPETWAYRPAKGAEQTLLRRAFRLVDAYSGIFGSSGFTTSAGVPANIPASRFLRPCSGRLAPLHPRHIATIKRGMTAAARAGEGYHLWWHPHNFGRNLAANMEVLRQIVLHFNGLRDSEGMLSTTMVGSA